MTRRPLRRGAAREAQLSSVAPAPIVAVLDGAARRHRLRASGDVTPAAWTGARSPSRGRSRPCTVGSGDPCPLGRGSVAAPCSRPTTRGTPTSRTRPRGSAAGSAATRSPRSAGLRPPGLRREPVLRHPLHRRRRRPSRSCRSPTTPTASESDPGPFPIPAERTASKPAAIGHVLVVQQGTCQLYELFAAQRRATAGRRAPGARFDR